MALDYDSAYAWDASNVTWDGTLLREGPVGDWADALRRPRTYLSAGRNERKPMSGRNVPGLV
jgi:hypothetical protein